MSIRKTQYALIVLCDAGLIFKEQRKGRSDIYRLAPTSNWKSREEVEAIRKSSKSSKVAVWDGRETGGTYLTIKMAKAKNISIARLSPTFPRTEQRFSLIEPEYKQLSLFDTSTSNSFNENYNNASLSHCQTCN